VKCNHLGRGSKPTVTDIYESPLYWTCYSRMNFPTYCSCSPFLELIEDWVNRVWVYTKDQWMSPKLHIHSLSIWFIEKEVIDRRTNSQEFYWFRIGWQSEQEPVQACHIFLCCPKYGNFLCHYLFSLTLHVEIIFRFMSYSLLISANSLMKKKRESFAVNKQHPAYVLLSPWKCLKNCLKLKERVPMLRW